MIVRYKLEGWNEKVVMCALRQTDPLPERLDACRPFLTALDLIDEGYPGAPRATLKAKEAMAGGGYAPMEFDDRMVGLIRRIARDASPTGWLSVADADLDVALRIDDLSVLKILESSEGAVRLTRLGYKMVQSTDDETILFNSASSFMLPITPWERALLDQAIEQVRPIRDPRIKRPQPLDYGPAILKVRLGAHDLRRIADLNFYQDLRMMRSHEEAQNSQDLLVHLGLAVKVGHVACLTPWCTDGDRILKVPTTPDERQVLRDIKIWLNADPERLASGSLEGFQSDDPHLDLTLAALAKSGFLRKKANHYVFPTAPPKRDPLPATPPLSIADDFVL